MLFIIAIAKYFNFSIMHTFLHTKFQINFTKFIQKHSNLLLAISSGQDSLCLLKLLYDYLNKYQYKIEAIYVDHQWKHDSSSHTQHIINIMRTTQIPITIYQMKQFALSENTARQIRYKIFIQHAIRKKCSAILTGHNKNDRVETLLHNIIRGTSLNGITNLTLNKKLNNQISIVRPLINFSRSEIAWFCRLFYLPVWSDTTNYNFYIKRNRLRYELIPYLQNHFNPQLQKILINFIDFCHNDHEYIKENTLKLYINSIHKRVISINLKRLSYQHKALQERVIKLFFYYHFQKTVDKHLVSTILNLNYINTTKILYSSRLIIYYYDNQIYVNSY